ncbi:hypothetical protein CUZ56_01347 [Saezia sanguinis]|uniref:DUF3742 domain-containing protein n=1 Tax=Saezia sanguinis TaxID=1965230 RepID=A0A433SFA3_9BURK|nr:DUF3742 family protein [Saezia sanguinis]RUS67402.1 hypothetical protein CUZ56_01347 [Saezia sanguinis]
MKTHIHSSKAKNFGYNAGKVWSWVQRIESAAVNWLSAKGLSLTVAKLLVFLVNLTIIAALFYVAFRLVMVAAFVFLFILFVKNVDLENVNDREDCPTGFTWQDGPQGHGLYTSFGDRVDVDPHDS